VHADLQSLPPARREAEVQRLLLQELETPFDLGRGPLLRARLLALDATTHVLLIAVHHIIFDGPSVDVLFAEVGALYGAYCAGATPPLAALPVQYADFAL